MGHGQVMLEGICVDACHVKVMVLVVGSFPGLGWVWRGKRWGASENHRPAALSDIQQYLPSLQNPCIGNVDKCSGNVDAHRQNSGSPG